MNIICLSLAAPPLNDPESFCTARFLSALVNAGHNVDLCTLDHPKQLDDKVVSQLLNPKIEVTLIPLKKTSKLQSIFTRIKYGFFGEYSKHIDSIYDALEDLVSVRDNPILITRSYPICSSIVGYLAKKRLSVPWIAHMSDPFPGYGVYSRRDFLIKKLDIWWSNRIVTKADLVSVTCSNAIRFFNDLHDSDFSDRCIVLGHIGTPSLKGSDLILNADNRVQFAHVGRLIDRRYLDQLIEEFTATRIKLGPKFLFLQYGPIFFAGSSHEGFDPTSTDWLNVLNGTIVSPMDATAVLEQSDVNVVVDQDDSIDYCPYLASKFAYAVEAGKPILAVGIKNSAMARMASEYGCFYHADGRTPGAIAEAVERIIATPDHERLRPTSELKELFTGHHIAAEFDKAVERLLPCPNAGPTPESFGGY